MKKTTLFSIMLLSTLALNSAVLAEEASAPGTDSEVIVPIGDTNIPELPPVEAPVVPPAPETPAPTDPVVVPPVEKPTAPEEPSKPEEPVLPPAPETPVETTETTTNPEVPTTPPTTEPTSPTTEDKPNGDPETTKPTTPTTTETPKPTEPSTTEGNKPSNKPTAPATSDKKETTNPPVTPMTQPVITDKGVTIVGTTDSQVIVAHADGRQEVVAAASVGGVVNADKTVTITTQGGKKQTLPSTGDQSGIVASIMGLLTLVGLGFKKRFTN
ncbi:LPXTG cell wall anchor domain-containing protein [Streptococcus ovuberis]|uniref:LPXTG cell wall anchor domain-containing protein n=1 Tax=Streptococcus ovuberis TaxID=1936207 RepID=A0A7X6MYG4_9STRE|nr:LPXTG cell wall anchor domain-containing protein [Streptococcus ovuberis]NKZ19691.1 LPXTG cell wall anchor domain-containing protein [Streptococcus ovuberis]